MGGYAGRRTKDPSGAGRREGRAGARGTRPNASRLRGQGGRGRTAFSARCSRRLQAAGATRASPPRAAGARGPQGRRQADAAGTPPEGAAAGSTHPPRRPPQAAKPGRRLKWASTLAPAQSHRLPALLGGLEARPSRWFSAARPGAEGAGPQRGERTKPGAGEESGGGVQCGVAGAWDPEGESLGKAEPKERRKKHSLCFVVLGE